MSRLVTPTVNRPKASEAWVDRLPELRDDNEVGDACLMSRAVPSDEGRQPILCPADKERFAVGIPVDHLDSASYWMIREPDPFGDVGLEHQSERPLRPHTVDRSPQIGAQCCVPYLLK